MKKNKPKPRTTNPLSPEATRLQPGSTDSDRPDALPMGPVRPEPRPLKPARPESMPLEPVRPYPPELPDQIEQVNRTHNPRLVSEKLLAGDWLLLEDRYATGLHLLSELKKRIFGKRKDHSDKDDSFLSYRQKRAIFRNASNRLVVPVEKSRIALKKVPEIGWLNLLYPDLPVFFLSFPQVQGLNSSWQWYRKGVRYSVLRHSIHPWYGVYFPTRDDHLLLFDEWLKSYGGSREKAVDMGTGCGVLAFQMIRHDFAQVVALDVNPNAVLSVQEEITRQDLGHRLQVMVSDLFDGCPNLFHGFPKEKSDLVVFNPPWLPADSAGYAPDQISMLDRAVYHEMDLFERFFQQAGAYVNEKGRVLVFYSNLGRQSGSAVAHPVEQELTFNRRFRKVRHLRRKVRPPSRKTRRRDHRKKEWVELWELAPCPVMEP